MVKKVAKRKWTFRHGRNGKVERVVTKFEGRIRAMKLAIEHRLRQRIQAQTNVITFTAYSASSLVHPLEVGKNGKAAFERV